MAKRLEMTNQERSDWNRLRNQANQAVKRAIEKGQLTNLKTETVICSACRQQRAVVYRHPDYTKKLVVEAVCMNCSNGQSSGPKCTACGSSNTVYKKNDGKPLRWCRKCGHEEPVK